MVGKRILVLGIWSMPDGIYLFHVSCISQGSWSRFNIQTWCLIPVLGACHCTWVAAAMTVRCFAPCSTSSMARTVWEGAHPNLSFSSFCRCPQPTVRQ